MDGPETEENLFTAGNWKLYGGMCKQLSSVVYKVLGVFPLLEEARPASGPGIQALCSLHIAIEKAKGLLQHCSECSQLYLAITADSILLKFEKARSTLLETLHRVEKIVPQDIAPQLLEIITELEETVFSLEQSEKLIGEQVIKLLQTGKRNSTDSPTNTNNSSTELELFHRAAMKLGIMSSRAALTERRALKKLIERVRNDQDKRKESVLIYLLHLMKKYSKLFRNEAADDTDSQGSSPCSPTVTANSCEDGIVNGYVFEKQLSKLGSFNFKSNNTGEELSGNSIPVPPEELRCPISLQLMFDPVVLSSGQTYERACIEKWFSNGHTTCPKTQQKLSHLSLTPNYCVKGLITSWCEQNGVPVPDGPPGSPDLSYWRQALSEGGATNSRSMEESGVSCNSNELNEDEDELERYKRWMDLLSSEDGEKAGDKHEAVEQIRFHLKDDEEARIYMGGNGFGELLVRFLDVVVRERHVKAQDVGAMALFNLAVNNDRNKELVLSAGVIPLIEEMIQHPETVGPATALYLNLSCLNEAKPIIGSGHAVPHLIKSLKNKSTTCRLDALYTLFNLSTHTPNIPSLLSSSIIPSLCPLLTAGITWADKALAILINLAMEPSGKKEMVSAPGLISSITTLLDTGGPMEQEQAASCLWVLCNGDEKCSQMVLQEGAIPALVLLSANGTARSKEKAQKLLKLFREQRQREISPTQEVVQLNSVRLPESRLQARSQELEVVERVESSGAGRGCKGISMGCVPEAKRLTKSRSRRLGRALTSMWKQRHHSSKQSQHQQD